MRDEDKATEPQPDPTPPERRSTAGTVVLWVAKLVVAGMLGYHGFTKLTGAEGPVALFTAIGMEPVGRYAIGVLEVMAAGAVLVPQSTVYGALLGLGVMIGAIIGHLSSFGLPGIQYALLVAAACLAILWIRRYDAEFIRNLWDR